MSPHEVSPPEEEGRSIPACHHHWIIEPATGPVSRGQCQSCQEVREFKNSVGDGNWFSESPRLAGAPKSVPSRFAERDGEYGLEYYQAPLNGGPWEVLGGLPLA